MRRASAGETLRAEAARFMTDQNVCNTARVSACALRRGCGMIRASPPAFHRDHPLRGFRLKNSARSIGSRHLTKARTL
jgi:hypothetical protein